MKAHILRDPGLGAEGCLEVERQLLVEEQKLCRVRTRKFTQETNLRRKAMEDRRKQWDVQEQRLRENILQQRRLRVQDATERFQRAHLPPSQRRRQSLRKNIPSIEDALHHIQGTLSSYERQSSFISSGSTIISRNCTPSPKPPTASKSSYCRALSAVEAYTKMVQERSMINLKNSQQLFVTETQVTKEREPETCSPQEHCVSHLNQSESLSSLDSLEKENPNHCITNPTCSQQSLLCDSERSLSVQRHKNDLHPSSTLTSPVTKIHLRDDLAQQTNILLGPQPRQQGESENLNKGIYNPSQVTQEFTSGKQTSNPEPQPPLGCCSLLTLCEIIDTDAQRCENISQGNGPDDKITVVTNNTVAPSNTACEFSSELHLGQQRFYNVRHVKHPSATEILMPSKNSNHKDILLETPPKLNISLKDSATANASQGELTQEIGKENNYPSTKNKSSDTTNNLNKVSNSEAKAERSKNTELLHQECLSNTALETPKCLKCPVEGIKEFTLSARISHSDSKICEVQFIKGILKKQSKYMSGHNISSHGSGHLIFAKQVALSIRDSLELTRGKSKDTEGNMTVKKKLRWFDEVNLQAEEKEQNISGRKQSQVKCKSANQSKSKTNSEDHHCSLTAVSGASRSGPAMTPPASTGYHFTKQAWADVGVQVGKLQEQGDEVSMPQSSTRTGGPKVPRRERSARVWMGPVSSRTRKGTVIRPQSATEVSQIARSQGKMMVPRPPPRTEAVENNIGDARVNSTKTPYSLDHPSAHCKQALLVEQGLHMDSSGNCFSPYTYHAIRADGRVLYTPLPSSYACPFLEANAKVTPSSGHQESQSFNGKKGLLYDEKGLCLDRTPTDEEISQLWQGVRSALATKDGDPRNFLTHNVPLSSLPQACANLSHVTINGDSLISGVKAISKMGGFFDSPSNARSLVKRQAVDSGGSRRTTCPEQSKQSFGSGSRRFLLRSQPIKQTMDLAAPYSSTYDLAHPGEDLESTAQFQLARTPAEDLLVERDIMTVMETAQAQRPGVVHQRDQQHTLTTISLEEQKILLSLERLNHQLHCVQKHAGGNGAARGHTQVDTPSARETKATSNHKQRAFSGDSRSRIQKRF
ncbi:centrosomal protein of 126 kDa [Lampris incognitus]|uniref:centrosomal protein of 126 kDa n=1 Tax=Lampris incognitus TaxID=2546036 RepID=UPI0024B51461|nr:centrosomal protein of 126 kDa [Lampris incognitus]